MIGLRCKSNHCKEDVSYALNWMKSHLHGCGNYLDTLKLVNSDGSEAAKKRKLEMGSMLIQLRRRNKRKQSTYSDEQFMAME